MEEVAAFWDAQARSFDDEPDHGLRHPAVRAAWSALLHRLLPVPAARVLDVGCGTGTLSILLAEQGHEVTGIDISPQMIEIACQKARAASVTIDLRVGDAADPHVDPKSFDVVLARHVLWALPDPALGLGRWISLLDDGGQLVLIEGRWSTGAGLTAAQTLELVARCGRSAEALSLSGAEYWGKPIDDERYIVISPAPPQPS